MGSQRLALAVVGMLVAFSGVGVAPSPSWDWQATFEFNAQEEITSRTLDFSSGSWLSCSSDWSLINTGVTTTSDTRSIDIIRADTAGQYFEHVIQRSGVVTAKLHGCTGTQIPKPSPDPPGENDCNVGLTGAGCTLICTAGGTVTAHIVTGIVPAIANSRLHAHCGGGDAHCGTGTANPLSCQDHATPINGGTTPQGCVGLGAGLYVNAHCHSS